MALSPALSDPTRDPAKGCSRDLATISRVFWRGVNTGQIRLTSAEDALLASLRVACWDWPFIARAILARRKRNQEINHAG